MKYHMSYEGELLMDKKTIVEVNEIGMTYHTFNGETEALRNIDFSVYEGEIVSIVGLVDVENLLYFQ